MIQYVQEQPKKIRTIRDAFSPYVGRPLKGYQCAECYLEEVDSWDRWDDMPVRLRFGKADVVSVAWAEFDDLFVAPDGALPDWYGGWPSLRWKEEHIPELDACIHRTLKNVMLGRGEMSIEGTDLEVWTRLVLEFDGIWFESFNALDENGYAQHHQLPDGEFRSCM